MYRLIVVDDEAIIRDGISSVVPWGSNGFELIGLFEDGVQALDFVRLNSVDVVISDINMPKMNGLELSKQIAAHFPDIMVLLLTGYDEFDYAQEAVRVQVREFLLKPITAAELGGVLENVKGELDAHRDRRLMEAQLAEKLEQSFPLLRERFLRRLISGRLAASEFDRQTQYFGWSGESAWHRVVVIDMPQSWTEVDRLSLGERIRGDTQPEDECFADAEDMMVLLLQGPSKDDLLERSTDLARRVFRGVSHSELEEITVGLGELTGSVQSLKASYEGALGAVRYAKVIGIARVLTSAEVREKESSSLDEFNALVDDLILQLRNGGKGESTASTKSIFAYLEDRYISPDAAVFYLAHLQSALYSFIKEMDPAEPTEVFLVFPERFESIQQAKDLFHSKIESIEHYIQTRRNNMVLSRIDKAKKIIAERYADSQFSLGDICDELYLSVSQFSALFKSGTGKTFVEYLSAYRISRAKELLKSSDMKMYEIAESVGYSDPRYFAIVFKKATGMTSREFQRSLST